MCAADTIMRVLRNDGNVLLPIDTAGRVLELVLHLEGMFSNMKLGVAYQLVLATIPPTICCHPTNHQLQDYLYIIKRKTSLLPIFCEFIWEQLGWFYL